MSRKYELMGMAAMIPGMQLAIEVMQAQLDQMRAALAQAQNDDHAPLRKVGRPRKAESVVVKDPTRGGWSADPEERKREMARRLAARQAKPKIRMKSAQKLHPRDAQHPNHEQWLRAVSKASKRSWAALSPAERQARIDATNAGRAVARANGAAA